MNSNGWTDNGIDLNELRLGMESFLEARRAENTRKAYASDRADFEAWIAATGLDRDSEQTIAMYVVSMAKSGKKVATIRRRLSALSGLYEGVKSNPVLSDIVRRVMDGVRRELGTAQDGAAPITPDVLARMSGAMSDSLLEIRDRAILALGLHAALRRSEIVALDVEDLSFEDQGVVVTVRRSKSDQEGEGRQVGVVRGGNPCPVKALEAWLSASGVTSGPVFRRVRGTVVCDGGLTGRSVALLVKRAAGTAGLDPDRFSGHSLRAGFVTAAVAAGAPEAAIMQQTGHRDADTMRRYSRPASVWLNKIPGNGYNSEGGGR